jgi:hypothetical protein
MFSLARLMRVKSVSCWTAQAKAILIHPTAYANVEFIALTPVRARVQKATISDVAVHLNRSFLNLGAVFFKRRPESPTAERGTSGIGIRLFRTFAV